VLGRLFGSRCCWVGSNLRGPTIQRLPSTHQVGTSTQRPEALPEGLRCTSCVRSFLWRGFLLPALFGLPKSLANLAGEASTNLCDAACSKRFLPICSRLRGERPRGAGDRFEQVFFASGRPDVSVFEYKGLGRSAAITALHFDRSRRAGACDHLGGLLKKLAAAAGP